MDNQHDAVLMILESELEGPSAWDDDPESTAFYPQEMQEVLSKRAEERVVAEASASADSALETALEEYCEQLLDEATAPEEQQTMMIGGANLLQIIIDRIRRAYTLYLWWVI